MPLNAPADDSLQKLADNLRELEIVIGERARPVVSELRAALGRAAALRQSGDVTGSLTVIRQAMERLAALAGELDLEEGAMMRAIARRFGDALSHGDRGRAKEAVELMRRKAGDAKDDDSTDW